MESTCTELDCDDKVQARGLCLRHYNRAKYYGELPITPSRPCAYCGQSFTGHHRDKAYCSRLCTDRARAARARATRLRRAAVCEQCGGSMEHRRVDARFCSDKCRTDWRNARVLAAARKAKIANRQPCVGCLGPIPPQRKGGALYCSEECKLRSRRHQAYGLTKDELDLLLAQHEGCAICKTDHWGKKGPQVDHNHATGAVRGILCGSCNQGLGRFGDDPTRLRAAVDYLESR